MSDLTRRDLLRDGALLTGSALAVGALAGCGSHAHPATSSRPASPVTPSDLRELAGSLRGTLITPSSAAYTSAHQVWNRRYDDVRPVAVAQVADVADVQTAVRFASDHGIAPIARNGRHSFAGYSTAWGALVIDVSRLRQLSIGSDNASARLGAGLNVADTYIGLWRHRMAIPGGTCPTVGLAGLTAGGGLGVLCRRHGLTCDSLTEVEIVTADASMRSASGQADSDLLWASRGGGGGNFGVITSLSYQLVPVDTPFIHVSYEFAWRDAVKVLDAWQHWFPTTPRGLWTAAELLTQDPKSSTPVIAVEVVFAGNPDDLQPVLNELVREAGTRPVQTQTDTSPFVNIPADFYCKGLRPAECQDMGISPMGKLVRPALYCKSNVASGPWPRAGWEQLASWMERRQRDRVLTPAGFSSSIDIGKVLIEVSDGAVNAPAPGATAYVHRNSSFVMQYQARWRPSRGSRAAAANVAWTDDAYAATASYRSGHAYQNYPDPELRDWQHAYYGDNLDRLRRIKAAYDPTNVFRFAQSIPPA